MACGNTTTTTDDPRCRCAPGYRTGISDFYADDAGGRDAPSCANEVALQLLWALVGLAALAELAMAKTSFALIRTRAGGNKKKARRALLVMRLMVCMLAAMFAQAATRLVAPTHSRVGVDFIGSVAFFVVRGAFWLMTSLNQHNLLDLAVVPLISSDKTLRTVKFVKLWYTSITVVSIATALPILVSCNLWGWTAADGDVLTSMFKAYSVSCIVPICGNVLGMTTVVANALKKLFDQVLPTEMKAGASKKDVKKYASLLVLKNMIKNQQKTALLGCATALPIHIAAFEATLTMRQHYSYVTLWWMIIFLHVGRKTQLLMAPRKTIDGGGGGGNGGGGSSAKVSDAGAVGASTVVSSRSSGPSSMAAISSAASSVEVDSSSASSTA